MKPSLRSAVVFASFLAAFAACSVWAVPITYTPVYASIEHSPQVGLQPRFDPNVLGGFVLDDGQSTPWLDFHGLYATPQVGLEEPLRFQLALNAPDLWTLDVSARLVRTGAPNPGLLFEPVGSRSMAWPYDPENPPPYGSYLDSDGSVRPLRMAYSTVTFEFRAIPRIFAVGEGDLAYGPDHGTQLQARVTQVSSTVMPVPDAASSALLLLLGLAALFCLKGRAFRRAVWGWPALYEPAAGRGSSEPSVSLCCRPALQKPFRDLSVMVTASDDGCAERA